MKQENLNPPDSIEMKPCPECNGLCVIRTGVTYDGLEYIEEDCHVCEGTGEVPAVPDRDDLDLEDDEDFSPCAECEPPNDCSDFGCAIDRGIKDDPRM